MPDGTKAQDRLQRLLHVLPCAAREGGALLADLARELDTTPRRILEDIQEVTTRGDYHPGGWPDDMLILQESDRVRVLHAGFDRPLRLSTNETLCLSVALRGVAAEARLADEAARMRLLERAEGHLVQQARVRTGSANRHDPEATPPGPPVEVDLGGAADAEGVRRTLVAAARERRPCSIHYVKPGADDGELRRIHPWTIVAAEGAWYALGWCEMADGVRAFRLDRILTVDVAEGSYEVPADFDPDDWLEGRHVYRSEADGRVRVRYGARIARWVRERAERDGHGWEEEPDGSVLVTHPLADEAWAIGHALQYGADAEIVEPEALRARCRGVLEGLAAD